MKKFIFCILFCSISSWFYAQDIHFSKPIKLNNKTPRFKILGRNINYFIAERWGNKYHYLDLYNTNLNRIASKELKIENDEKLKKIWVQPKKGWLVYTKAFKDYNLILANQLDSKFNIRTKALKLDSLVEKRDLVERNLRTTLSLNEKYIALYIPIFNKGSVSYFRVIVYDTEMKLVQKFELKNTYIKHAAFVDLLVLNTGDVVTVFKEKEESNDFQIYYNKIGEAEKIYKLNLDFEVYKQLKIEADNLNHKIILAGQRLNTNNKTKSADAFFSLSIDLVSGKKSKLLTEVYTQDFYKLLTGKESTKEHVSLQTFYINRIIPRLDSGYLVFLESFYENEEIIELNSPSIGSNSFSTTQNNLTTYQSNYYFYNDVIVYQISDNYKVQSVNIIRKKQSSENDNGGYSSFKIVNQQDALELLFLDQINTEASLKNYTITKESELYKDYILNIAQNNVMPVVKLSMQTAPNEILVPSYLNNKFSLIKIVFEDH